MLDLITHTDCCIGMTPTSVWHTLVAAVYNAGYHGELAGGYVGFVISHEGPYFCSVVILFIYVMRVFAMFSYRCLHYF